MNCAQFERELQRLADGDSVCHDVVALQSHANECAACRELEDGFRLIAQGFLASREPEPSPGLADRVIASLETTPASPRRWAGWLVPLATAASLVLSATWWSTQPQPSSLDRPISVPQSPPLARDDSTESLLFPELAQNDGDASSDDALLGEAMRPVSQIAQVFGRTLQHPARPIGLMASEAIGSLLKDLPDPNTTMMSMPLMRGLMPDPMQRAMKPMPSS